MVVFDVEVKLTPLDAARNVDCGLDELKCQILALSKEGRWDEMPRRIEPAMLAKLAARGTPEEVASDIRGRFGHHVDQVCIYTPYAIEEACFGELVDALR